MLFYRPGRLARRAIREREQFDASEPSHVVISALIQSALIVLGMAAFAVGFWIWDLFKGV